MTNPSLPKGTRDFGPEIVRKRDFIFTTIRNVFELYGFQPLETPAMENLETLMGKYGDEGDKLIFKILNNGLDNPAKHELARKDFENVLQGKSASGITERALKYDLTIPFARYIAMNHTRLIFPFKRYQIQPVWRADRPQKGRYREFYQCDADVVGSNSLLNEIELVNIYHQVFTQLGITGYELKINHRKILTALAEQCGRPDKMNDIAVAIDKLEKIGKEKVKDELIQKGYSGEQIILIEKYISISGSKNEKLAQIKILLSGSESGKKGIEELEFILNALPAQDINCDLESRITLDFSLARGLNYYTGIIFEVKPPAGSLIGSIGGGGRYDDLTGLFGVPDIPGTGISFGVDRIFDVMEELNLFPAAISTGTKVLFFNLGEKESQVAFKLVQQLRVNKIAAELFHEIEKPIKQFKYAEKKKIPYVVMIDSDDLQKNTCTVKNIVTGEKQVVTLEKIISYNF